MRFCSACKQFKDPKCFGTFKKDPSKLLAQCSQCTEYKRKYAKSSKGKAFTKKRNADPKRKEYKKEHAQKESSRVVQRAAAAALEATGKYEERRTAWKKSPNGQKLAKRMSKNRSAKLREDPAARLAWNIRVRLYSTLTGRIISSKTIKDNTEFSNCREILDHFEALLSEGMTMDNYGSVWHIDHRIALCWYDHSDPDDVLRCWSKANLVPLFGVENVRKSYKIQDSECVAVGPGVWPKSWNGGIPSQEERRVMYSRLHAGSK
jgi:hypothetical protein